MKLKAIVRVRRGKPVELLIETPTVVGSINLMPSSRKKDTVVVEDLGELEDGDEVVVDVSRS